MEEEGATAIDTWRVKPHSGHQSETFLFGNEVLRIVETLAVNDDVAIRLKDWRTKDMLYASVVLDLQELGLSATVLEHHRETRKRHNVLIVPLRASE